MSRTWKKLLSVILTLTMVVSMLPMSVLATEVVSDLPVAEVTKMEPIVLPDGGYGLWDGSFEESAEDGDKPLQIVMNFKAKETLEEAKAGKYGKYKTDFYLTLSGMSGESIVAKDCYLAGNYGEFGWIVIPTDGKVLENEVEYPVVSNYDTNLTYEDICGSVKDFTAAIYVAPAILKANPDLKVTLALKMTNPEDANDVLTIGEPAVYTVNDLAPVAAVTLRNPVILPEDGYTCWPNGENNVSRPLEVVVNFKATETLEEAQAGVYGKWPGDFYVTVTGLADESITADGCYLAGNYGAYGWIVIPMDGAVIEEGVSNPVVSRYDAKLTYENICDYVKDFTAAIHVTPEILAENPNMKIELALKLKDPATGEFLVIGEPAIYDVEDLKSDVKVVVPDFEDFDEAEKQIAEDVIHNTAISAVENTGMNEATNEDIVNAAREELEEKGASSEAADVAVPTVAIALVEIEANAVTYDVTPKLIADGKEVAIKEWNTPVTFRLPVPSAVTAKYAEVYHGEEVMGVYTIHGDAPNKYVEVTSASFSKFAVKPATEAPVATVNGVGYTTLQAAIDAADGKTVTLLGDIALTEGITIAAGKTVTLDLAGKTVSQEKAQTEAYGMIVNNGVLTVTDSVGDGKISYKDITAYTAAINYASNTITNMGVLNVKGGTIENVSSDNVANYGYPHAIDVYPGSTTNISGGTVRSANYDSIRMFCNSTTEATTVNISGGTIINRVTFQNPYGDDRAANGVLNITGGDFTSTNGVNANVRLLAFGKNYDAMSASISDGTFDKGVAISNYSGAAVTWTPVKGGTFSSAVPAEFCAEGYVPKDNGDGTYGVKEAVTYVAEIVGGDKYETLQDAIAAAADGATVKLLSDVTITEGTAAYNDGTYIDGVRYTGDKSFTIDFNGFTVTDDGCVNDYLIYLNNKGEKANEITFKNGTIIAKNGCWSTVCVNSSVATQETVLNLDNMKITNSNDASYSGNPVVRARNKAIVNVNNDTVITSDGASYGVAANVSESVVNINSGATVIQKNSGTTGGNSVFAAVGGKGVINIYDGAIIESDRYGVHTMTTGTPVINVYGGTITAPVALKASTNGGTGELATINVTGGTITGGLETYTDNGKIAVSGGTFYEPVDEKYCANGYVPKDNGNGTYGVVVDTYVAEIVGGAKYETLAEALAAAQAGDEITLLAPVVVAAGETLTLNKAVTITYTSNAPGEDMITNRGKLVVDGATLVYTNTDTTASNVTVSTISCEPGSVTEIKSGVVKNDSANNSAKQIYAYAIDLLTNGNLGDVTATISGGEVTSTNYMAIRQFNNGTACKNTLTVTGGEIYGAKRAIQVHLDNDAAYTTISGGAVKAGEGGYALCLFPKANTNMVIEGGTFTGSVYSGTNGIISGGTFSEAVEAEYCANGYVPKENADGTYGVVAATYVAEIVGGAKYETLQAAIDAADGKTVTLLDNIALTAGVTVAKGKTVTLDLNGKTISGTCNANQAYLFMVYNTAKLTIKDSSGTGKITYAGENSTGWIVDVEGDLVLESGTLELTGSWSIGYAVDVRPNAWGVAYTAPTTFVMNGGQIVSSDGAVRVASSSVASDKNVSASFTMNGGTIDAAWDGVFVQQSDAVWDDLSFTMTGGTIKSALNPIRLYGPAATSYVNGEDCVDIALNGGTLTYTGTEAREWLVQGIIRTGGGAAVEDFLKDTDVTASETFAASNVAEGYEWVAGTDGKYTLQAATYVAEVGGVKFTDLQDAIDAADDETVKLLDNIALTAGVTVAKGKTVTLDLNGKTVSGNITEKLTKSFALITNKGTLTVQDSAANGKISLNYGGASFGYGIGLYTISNEGGTLNITGGTVENLATVTGSMYDAIDNNSTLGDTVLNISGGTVSCASYLAIRQFANSTTAKNDVNITGGTVAGGNSSVWMQNPNSNANKASVSVSGGTIKGRILAGESDVFTYSITGGLFDEAAKNGTAPELLGNYEFTGTPNADGFYGVEEKAAVEVSEFDIAGKTLLLEDTVAVKYLARDTNLYTQAFIENIDNVALLIWTGEDVSDGATYEFGTETYKVGLKKNGNLYEAVAEGVAAKNMGDKQIARLYIKTESGVLYGAVIDYNPATYAYNKYTANAAEKELVAALMNYGAEAQLLFNHNADNLMNAFLSDADKNYLNETYTVEPVKADTAGKFAFETANVYNNIGRTCVLEDKVEIKIIFNLKSEYVSSNMTLLYWDEATYNSATALTEENATAVTLIKNGSYYTATIEGTAAKNLGDTYFACAKIVNSNSEVIYSTLQCVSAHLYAGNRITGDKDEKNLCIAMVQYSNVAKDFFN